MNYHNSDWIFQKMREHYNDVLHLFPEDRVVAVCLAGSQNYGLDVEGSDVDTKAIIIPSFKELATNAKPISTTYVRDNGEQIDLKDIRLMAECWKKQNLNFLEILFTNYFMPYGRTDYYEFTMRNANRISRYNPWKAVKTMQGLALTKYTQLKHNSPSHEADLAKYGYSRKELHHLLRIEEFIERYTADETFLSCMRSDQATFLKDVKINGVGSVEKADEMAVRAMEHIYRIADHYCSTHENKANPEVAQAIDDFVYQQMEKSIRKEFVNE